MYYGRRRERHPETSRELDKSNFPGSERASFTSARVKGRKLPPSRKPSTLGPDVQRSHVAVAKYSSLQVAGWRIRKLQFLWREVREFAGEAATATTCATWFREIARAAGCSRRRDARQHVL